MKARWIRLAALVAMGAMTARAQAPVPVAERATTQFDRTTRVSLFSNHVVVVTIRSDAEQFVHRATLEYEEYMVYLQAIESFAAGIGDAPVSSDVESRESSTELVLHVGPDAPRIFRYSPLASLDLSVGKIAALMDDLQARALAAMPGEHELREWQPRVGDCVDLRHGGEACVTEVGEDGTIVLSQDQSGLSITVGVDQRAEVILELHQRSP